MTYIWNMTYIDIWRKKKRFNGTFEKMTYISIVSFPLPCLISRADESVIDAPPFLVETKWLGDLSSGNLDYYTTTTCHYNAT